MATAIYVRVSTLEQAEEGYSVEEQIEKLKKFCEVKNWNVSSVYKDGGFTGSNLKRPGMTNLIRDAKRKKFDTVLVYKLDRLSRSQKDALYLIEDVFSANNVAFVSLNENFDTSTAFGKAMIGILAVFAQLEREQIKERMTMGKVGRAKSGKAMGWAKTPFGYNYVDGTYQVDPIQAPVVKRIFHEYLAGTSITKIMDILNEEGHIGKDYNWYHRTVREILLNPVFAGYIRFKEELYPGNHEALITKKEFDKTQKELKIRQQKAYEINNNPRPFQSKYMLSGLIKCGLCGASFEMNLQAIRKDGSRKKYYKCYSRASKKHNRTMYKNPNGCSSENYDVYDMEHTILTEIEKIRVDPGTIEDLAINNDKEDLSAYEKRINELDKSLEKLVDLFLDNEIPKDMLEKRKEKILTEKDTLENKIKNTDVKEPITSAEDAKSILSNINDSVFNLSYEEQFTLAKKLIHQIYIYPSKTQIRWNFSVSK